MWFVYFIYGLSFFALGLGIALYPKRGSSYPLARDIWLIAAFGVLHGINEWIDMALIILDPVEAPVLRVLSVSCLPVSFLFLIQFGVRNLGAPGSRTVRLGSLYAILLVVWGGLATSGEPHFRHADIWARYLLGTTGTLLTAWALFRQSRTGIGADHPTVGMHLKIAAGAFALYGLASGLVVHEADFFPANWLNYTSFNAFFGFPAQWWRTSCALVIAVSLLQVLGVFEWELKDQLRRSKDQLEVRVAERTAELATANRRLLEEVNERERVGVALAQSEERYRRLVEQSPEAIMIEQDNRLRFANSAALALVGAERFEQIADRSLAEFLDFEGGKDYLRRMAELVEPDGTVPLHEERWICLNGLIRDVQSAVLPVVYEGRDALQVVAVDISDLKKLRAELLSQQKLESLGVFAGGIAHGFNNLMAGILGKIQVVRLDLKPESRSAEQLREAEEAALGARYLTDQLLTFAEGGVPVKKVISLRQLVGDCAKLAVGRAELRCTLDIPDDLAKVEVDPGQITHVIGNLIGNAVEVTPKGGRIRVSATNETVGPASRPLLVPGPYVKLSITDEGPGIPDSVLTKIFDPFFTTKETGSGLGLTTAKGIISRHGGHIFVESPPGQGTTFHIYLPVAQGQIPEEKAPPAPRPSGNEAMGKILVMDDEDLIRTSTRIFLQRLGYRVEVAPDGEEALRMYEAAYGGTEPFDAVVMDLTVPGGMGGREAMEALLKLDPRAKAVVSSGYSDDPVMADYRRFGFVAVLAKPYELDDLHQTLNSIVADGRTDGNGC